ncbi:MAG: hypothetical protein ACREBG_01430 [Pyrinomonadaceae bacterium]
MTRLEKIKYSNKAHTAGAFGVLSRCLVVLFAATVSWAPTATVLAQQPAPTGGQAQGSARERRAETDEVRPSAMKRPIPKRRPP